VDMMGGPLLVWIWPLDSMISTSSLSIISVLTANCEYVVFCATLNKILKLKPVERPAPVAVQGLGYWPGWAKILQLIIKLSFSLLSNGVNCNC